jgi:hypothetical protein
MISYTSKAVKEDLADRLFIILISSFLAVKFFIRYLVPDVPESANIINIRHSIAVDKILRGLSKSRSMTYKPSMIN